MKKNNIKNVNDHLSTIVIETEANSINGKYRTEPWNRRTLLLVGCDADADAAEC